MASKEVKKEVLQETQKETPKKRRRLKRSVRKTLGAVFLASAIAVAAIPTEGLQAADPVTTRPAAKDSIRPDSKDFIPHFNAYKSKDEPGDNVYLSGDGKFLFAFSSNGTSSPVAVILGYESGALGSKGELVIPGRVEPYIKFTNTLGGSETGYVAVGSMENFLYWKETKTVREPVMGDDGEQKKNPDGTLMFEDKEVFVAFHPCYANEKEKYWGKLPASELYYDGKQVKAIPGQGNMTLSEEDAVQATEAIYQPTIADVKYIGNQYLVQNDDEAGVWRIGGDVDGENKRGVFAKGINIVNLEISKELIGIGDYAFYNCTNLDSMYLADGLKIIAEGAFEGCLNMKSIDWAINVGLQTIGARAFYYCEALSSFTLPSGVETIGDSAFEHCEALTSIDLLTAGRNNALREVGIDLFKDCRSLQNITFPNKVTGDIWLSSFQGCEQLHWISTRNNDISFIEETGVFTYDDFKKMLAEGTTVDGTFYFEGFTDSDLHKMTRENCFAFSHIGYNEEGAVVKKDRYELTVQEVTDGLPDSNKAAGRATYEVNSRNQLNRYEAGEKVDSVTIPNHIGPYVIATINEGVFSDNCSIVKVEIPANVKVISANAFRGCHNLKDVIFDSGDIEIGANAFKTQETKIHSKIGCSVENAADGSPKVKLNFVGPVSYSSGPFKYAMSTNGKYNIDTQTTSYITYFTGWPQNMEIRFNPDAVNPETGAKGMSELFNFPSLKDLVDGVYKNANYVYITEEQEKMAISAIKKYTGEDKGTMLEGEQAILDAALKIVIPEGVESVKPGLFKDKEIADMGKESSGSGPLKTVTAYSLKAITCEKESSVSGGDAQMPTTGTFIGCSRISSIDLRGGVVSVDSYAFKDCTALTEVKMPLTVKTMGIRPFAGCSKLADVKFIDNPKFTCENSIIFELKNGSKDKVVECLEGRTSVRVKAEELEGVSGLYEEAFMMGDAPVSNVDLSKSNVDVIPKKAFMGNGSLREIVLPDISTEFIIHDDAFTDCPILDQLTIPGMYAQISTKAFEGTTKREGKIIWFYCHKDSSAWKYADLNYPYIDHEETKPVVRWNVRFGYYDEKYSFVQIGETQSVLEGTAATPPSADLVPKKAGYEWNGVDWIPPEYEAVYRHMDVTPNYVPASEVEYTITYLFEDQTVYTTQKVKKGADVIPVQAPAKAGYVCIGWRIVGGDGTALKSLKNVQSNLTLSPVYRPAEAGEDDGTGMQTPGPGATNDPNATKDPNATNDPNNPNNPNNPGSGNGTSGKFYNLTVQNGSGSGSYVEGAQPVIIANNPVSGQEFDHWSVSPADVKIASTVLSASIITMPASDVTVTAHYKAKSGSDSDGSGGSGSGNNTQRPNGNSGSENKGGTTVVIDKNGLSNTGVVSATVNGSSDNFTIKISESAEATEAALRALMAEYGDNLDNIKFFPMDISLYDSTGTTKIKDTTGLSVSITLPLPDSLITYAGNNRVASVRNDKLERLSARFTTIQGVSCITFTAEHFSPYVIYVNTGDLSSGHVSDSTPQTGDFIHPKWFLSIALACLSFIFFMQKDTRKEKKVKVKVRA